MDPMSSATIAENRLIIRASRGISAKLAQRKRPKHNWHTNKMNDGNISGNIKANIPNHVVFAVTTVQESNLLGVNGSKRPNLGEIQVKTGNL